MFRFYIGCDFHPYFQRIAMLETETGELVERNLNHEGDETRAFYAGLPSPALVGIESTGYADWFQQMLAELGHTLWIGDAARIRAMDVRKQKHEPRDAAHILDLLAANRFPRVWVPTAADRDVRQLLWHRHKLVGWQTAIQNQLHFVAMSQGLRRGKKLWTAKGRRALEDLTLLPWTSRRRQELLEMLDGLAPKIAELDAAVEQEARRRPEALRLMECHRGVGPITALAFALIVGPVERFARSKQLVSYLGLNPSEHSSGGHQRLGPISKQGNTLLRWLLVEAGQSAARSDPEMHRHYVRLSFRRGRPVAKVAVAPRLAVQMFWTLRTMGRNAQPVRTPGSPSHSVVDSSPSTF